MKKRRNYMCNYCVAGSHRQCKLPSCNCLCWEPLSTKERSMGFKAIHPEGRGVHSRGCFVRSETAIRMSRRRGEASPLSRDVRRQIAVATYPLELAMGAGK